MDAAAMLWLLRLLSRPWQWQWQGEYFGIRLREGGREGREEGGNGRTDDGMAWQKQRLGGAGEREGGREGEGRRAAAATPDGRGRGGEGGRGCGILVNPSLLVKLSTGPLLNPLLWDSISILLLRPSIILVLMD